MNTRFCSLLLSLTLLLPLCNAAFATDETAFRNAFGIMEKARAGDENAVGASVEAFDQLSRQEPTNPLLRAYLGSAQSMQGKYALLPWNKMKYTENGLATVDKALQQLGPEHDHESVRGVPISIETRLVAASTFLALPSMFNRSVAGHQQLQTILDNPALLKAPEGIRRAVIDLALKTAHEEKLPAERIAQLQMLSSNNLAEREAAQAKLKELWK